VRYWGFGIRLVRRGRLPVVIGAVGGDIVAGSLGARVLVGGSGEFFFGRGDIGLDAAKPVSSLPFAWGIWAGVGVVQLGRRAEG
jgi:hypothetical protein